MKLYIVMPGTNCVDLSEDAYTSVLKSELPEGLEYRFLMVDQASHDPTKNWKEVHPECDYIRNDPRISVSGAWNQGIKKALEWGADYILVINNDIYLHPKTIKHLIAFMDKTGYLMVTADNIQERMSLETMLQMELPVEFTDYDCNEITDWRAEGPDFSCFMINADTVKVVGYFDENFKGAYCEDQDYHIRINRARVHAEQHNDQGVEPRRIHAKRLSTAPYMHYSSQTLTRNKDLRHEISVQHGRNQGYLLRKWGAEHPLAMDGHGNTQPFGDARMNWRDW